MTSSTHKFITSIALIVASMLLASCGARADTAVQPGNGAAVAVPNPSQPTAAALLNSTSTESGILYIKMEYYQLEGIPPYPSKYVAIDARDETWIDMSDPQRIRYERTYRTQETPPREGKERYYIGTGRGGQIKDCSLYDGKEDCSTQTITQTVDFDGWLNSFNQPNAKFVANMHNASAIGGYTYKGTQTDPQWGEVHVFERQGSAKTSDLYPNKPTIETMKIGADQPRLVELSMTVLDGDTQVPYRSYRLKEWNIVDPSTLPADFF
ncbi:MAG: hypothetical protein MUD01_18480, partial [Chloroflexaceae bacterium]|nr:hypothetical protein [Chloroflexaceae bacterium]